MKKFTKFLGIFLALSMVIGMLSVVGAVDPETPTAPAAPTGAIKQGTTYEVVSPTRIETLFGFYEDGTGADEGTFMDCEDGACVTDGWFGRAGYSECTSADGLIALVMMVDDFVNLGGIEIVCKDADHAAAKFDVQVMGDSDWETVVSVDANPFTDNLTKTYTFDAVETDTVRILIHEVATNDQCYFNEVTLFEATTGNLKNTIDLNGKITSNNMHASHPATGMVNGDKSDVVLGSNAVFGLDEATAIDGFNLYCYRTNGSNVFPNNVTINIQKTEGGEFESIGTFATGWSATNPLDSVYVTFDQTYMAYAVQVLFDVNAYFVEFELWQYDREPSAEPEATEPEATEPEATEPEATEPEATVPVTPAPTYTWMDLIPESSLTPHVGYYVGDDYTTLTDECASEAEILTDARVSSGSWVHGNTFPVPSGKTPAAVVEVGGTKIIAGVDICCKPGQELADFVVEVLDTNGNWVTVNTTTGNTATDVKIVFDTAVTGTAVRLIINDWNGDHPMVQELWIYEGLNTEALVQVPVAGVTASQNPVVPEQPVEMAIDGKGYTYYQIGAGNMPVAIVFDTTNPDGSATNVSRMRIYAFNNSKQAAKDIIVDVKTSNEPETWETVYTGVAYELNHTDTFVLDFGATYAAYDVRLTINTVTADNLVLTEVELFGNGEPVAPPVAPPVGPEATEPSVPTEPEATEPSVPTEPEATEPEATEPSVPTEPEATEPSAPTEPEATEPETTEPSAPAEVIPEAPVVAPGTTTIENGVIKTGKVYKIVSPTKLTTVFGFYGTDGAFVDKQDGACVTDGWYGRAGYSECTAADGQIALITTINEATTIGAIEIVGKNANNNPVDFEIQAMINGQWVTIVDVNEDPFTAGLTKTFTFAPVTTNQVRVLVNKVAVETEQCYFNEISLFEVVDGKLFNKIDLNGKGIASDAHTSSDINWAIDADKSTFLTGSTVTVNLTNEGAPTSIDGFNLYYYRNSSFPNNITINIQKTEGGEFETIGTFATGFTTGEPQDSLFVEFDQTYTAYAVQFVSDVWGYQNDYELYQYEKEEAPEQPPVGPGEDPTEPSEPTEPSVPTEPSEPTDPSVPTEPSEPSVPTEPSEPSEPTEPSVPTEPSEPTTPSEPETPTEPSEPELPDVPELPGLSVDITELQTTIDLVYDLNPNLYTAESYEALVEVIKQVNAIIAQGNYTEELIAEINEMLVTALNDLVLIDGGSGSGDSDLPADTGDIMLSVLTGMMALSAIGGAVVISKKKFF